MYTEGQCFTINKLKIDVIFLITTEAKNMAKNLKLTVKTGKCNHMCIVPLLHMRARIMDKWIKNISEKGKW